MEFIRENLWIVGLVLVIIILIGVLVYYVLQQRRMRHMSYNRLKMGVNPMYEKPHPSNYVPRSRYQNKDYFDLSSKEDFSTMLRKLFKKR
ncbi:MAG: hypothetical protein E7191_03455 [Erysipelotrichaceae bacterium]|nr:hypothetical protein [Erysipelotrichaceae bacterium]MBQ9987727.1 hypothetical protein [Erysipelotrichales bacterium]MBR3694206.1 hypothetical protein [Erysipelotrichales bacterium]